MSWSEALKSRLRALVQTRSGKEAAIGIPIVIIWIVWLLQPAWQESARIKSIWNAPIVGLEDVAPVTPDRARGEAAFRKALELEWLDGVDRPVPVYQHPRDEEYKQARALYLEAVRYGYHEATGYLGFSYLNRRAGDRLPAAAIRLFERGIKQNDPVSMRGMGLVLDANVAEDTDIRMERDSPRALGLYERAANLGDVESQYYAGAMYLNHSARPDEERYPYLRTVISPWSLKNETKGLFWLNKAIGNGDRRAYDVLRFYYRSSDPEKSYRYGIEGARRGDTGCMFSLYSNFGSESSTYGRDVERSECYHGLYNLMVRDRTVRFPDLETRCRSTIGRP